MKSTIFNVTYIIVLTLFVFLSFSCKEKKTEQQGKNADTKVEFKQETFNFGEITEGEIVTHSFYFKNIGKQNFVIRNIESGCGCTTVEYDKAPVQPGKEGKIEIAFNSSGRYGKQYKEISIFANVPEKTITLKFTASVK